MSVMLKLKASSQNRFIVEFFHPGDQKNIYILKKCSFHYPSATLIAQLYDRTSGVKACSGPFHMKQRAVKKNPVN